MPLISVIIPCFNAEPFIRETLQSALIQDIPGIEVIVIDDGSTDNSASIVEKEFPFVHLVRTENHGPSSARNLGTKLSKGEFIQYLDADDLLERGKLKAQLKALQESGADVAYGDWQKLRKDANGNYIKEEIIRRRLQDPDIDFFTCDCWCPPAAYLFRRSIVERTGGWDEELWVGEDTRFIIGCSWHKARFIYLPTIVAYYRIDIPNSASTRNCIKSVKCRYNLASQVEARWLLNGGIDLKRKMALIKVYGGIARLSFNCDKDTFEKTYTALKRLTSHYIPQYPRKLKLVSLVIGYRNSEYIALYYRFIKKLLLKKEIAEILNAIPRKIRCWKWRCFQTLSLKYVNHTLLHGVKMRLYLDSPLCQLIYCYSFEAAERKFLIKFLKKGDIFLDIGANVGLFTLIAAHKVGKTGYVYTFEPQSMVYARLEENIKLNNFSNVSCYKCAFSNTKGEAKLKIPLNGDDVFSSLGHPSSGTVFDTELVETTTLDAFIEDNHLLGRIKMIKVDVEGWEINVLKGGSRTLSQPNAPILQVEFTEQNMKNAGFSCKDLYQFLEILGYKLYTYTSKRNQLLPEQLRDDYPYINLFAIKDIDAVKKRFNN